MPGWLREVGRTAEPLWVASMAALFVVWGYEWIPRVIRLLGRGGQTETVEWAVYVSLLLAFPVAVLIVAIVLPRRAGDQIASVIKGSVILLALSLGLLFVADGRSRVVALALLPAAATALATLGMSDIRREASSSRLPVFFLLFIVGIAAWMMAGGLVYWDRGADWLVGSPVRVVALAAATACALWGLPAFRHEEGTEVKPGRISGWLASLLLIGLAAFSFRTNPVVEFYHWGFWVGPMEQLRQGGALLQDTPSQYGFLSILIPTPFPGTAWQAFWFYQAAIYGMVALIMFVVLRRLRSGPGSVVLAFAVIFTTLFFRPRSASLILPAQMTPSGGPVRFLWCFVMLGYLVLEFERRRRISAGGDEPGRARGFPLVGHAIWLCAVAWSFESAIYCSAIWFAAFGVYLLQRARADRQRNLSRRSVAVRTARSAAVPLLLAVAFYGVIWIGYRLALGTGPDLTGYFEYGFLYSRGYGALPIDTEGAIWYLLLAFFIASSAAVQLLVEDWRDFRMVVAAGAWGAIWSVSSYFVSRSHPVNLLSITPVLLFALAVLFVVVKAGPRRGWEFMLRAALVPVFAMPVALTLGHPGLRANLRTPQLSLARFTDQVPQMDPVLEGLMREAGATPGDPVVLIADGRLMLPAWRGGPGEPRVLSERSWLPKPYEIIGTLSPERRQVYLRRAAETRLGGWMIHHQTDTLRRFGDHLTQILETHAPTRQHSRGPWTVWWMAPREPRF